MRSSTSSAASAICRSSRRRVLLYFNRIPTASTAALAMPTVRGNAASGKAAGSNGRPVRFSR